MKIHGKRKNRNGNSWKQVLFWNAPPIIFGKKFEFLKLIPEQNPYKTIKIVQNYRIQRKNFKIWPKFGDFVAKNYRGRFSKVDFSLKTNIFTRSKNNFLQISNFTKINKSNFLLPKIQKFCKKQKFEAFEFDIFEILRFLNGRKISNFRRETNKNHQNNVAQHAISPKARPAFARPPSPITKAAKLALCYSKFDAILLLFPWK